jgi:hypothetical protein
MRCSWLPKNVHWLAFHHTEVVMMLLPCFLTMGAALLVFSNRIGGGIVGFLLFICMFSQAIGPVAHPAALRLRASTLVCRRLPTVATPSQRRADWLQALTRQDVRTSFVGAPTWNSYWLWMAVRLVAVISVCTIWLDRDLQWKTGILPVILVPCSAILYQAYGFIARRVFLSRLTKTLSTPLCPSCGYDLSSFASVENSKSLPRCPECGTKHPLFVPPIPPPPFTYPTPGMGPGLPFPKDPFPKDK